MIIYVILMLVVTALVFNAFFKFKAYNKSEKTIWEDGDSVRIKGKDEDEQSDHGFMTRIG